MAPTQLNRTAPLSSIPSRLTAGNCFQVRAPTMSQSIHDTINPKCLRYQHPHDEVLRILTTMAKHYTVYTDTFHNVQRLDLFKYDGSPMNPMFLAFNPPQMLPTQTLKPTNAASSSSTSTATNKVRVKRDTDPGPRTLPPILTPPKPENYDRLWWLGLGMIGLGTMLYGWSK